MELRFKTIERPRGYRYTDESRLWNTGADLILNNGVENLGKEWYVLCDFVKHLFSFGDSSSKFPKQFSLRYFSETGGFV